MRPLFLFSAGVMLMLLLLEGIFQLLPVSTATQTGYQIHPRILTYPPNHCFTSATGWDLRNAQRNCANNLGFLADHDFVYNPQAVALIGDSFVEANMLPANDRLAAQLESRLAGRFVYALGSPGTNLLDYAERARFAASRLGIRTFVFVLTRVDVREALCGSGNGHGLCIDRTSLEARVEPQLSPGSLKKLFRQSATAQYLFSQLKFKLSTLTVALDPGRAGEGRTARYEPSEEATGLVVNTFFSEISEIDKAQYYFVIEPEGANQFSRYSTSTEIEQFKRSAKEFGSIVIDPTEPFRNYASNFGLSLEVGPYDKHWNKVATRILADLLSGVIASEMHVGAGG